MAAPGEQVRGAASGPDSNVTTARLGDGAARHARKLAASTASSVAAPICSPGGRCSDRREHREHAWIAEGHEDHDLGSVEVLDDMNRSIVDRFPTRLWSTAVSIAARMQSASERPTRRAASASASLSASGR